MLSDKYNCWQNKGPTTEIRREVHPHDESFPFTSQFFPFGNLMAVPELKVGFLSSVN